MVIALCEGELILDPEGGLFSLLLIFNKRVSLGESYWPLVVENNKHNDDAMCLELQMNEFSSTLYLARVASRHSIEGYPVP